MKLSRVTFKKLIGTLYRIICFDDSGNILEVIDSSLSDPKLDSLKKDIENFEFVAEPENDAYFFLARETNGPQF